MFILSAFGFPCQGLLILYLLWSGSLYQFSVSEVALTESYQIKGWLKEQIPGSSYSSSPQYLQIHSDKDQATHWYGFLSQFLSQPHSRDQDLEISTALYCKKCYSSTQTASCPAHPSHSASYISLVQSVTELAWQEAEVVSGWQSTHRILVFKNLN